MMTYSDDGCPVLAVADGHGGEPYVRSGFGAHIACKAALKVMSDRTIRAEAYPARIKAIFDSYVAKHLRLHPLTEDEKEKLGDDPEHYAYGTTLIAAKLTCDGTYMLHIGDGKLCAVKRNGEFFPEPPKDPDCVGNITSSLVTDDAEKKIRTAYYNEPAGCVILHTDGYDPDGEYPWRIFENIGEGYSQAGLMTELEEGDKNGDDQTAVVFYDEKGVDAAAFRAGVEKEKEKYREKCQRALLIKKMNDLKSFLTAALEKCKRLEDEGLEEKLEEFKIRSVQPRYKAYMELRRQLGG